MLKNIVIFVFGVALCFFVQDYVKIRNIANKAYCTAKSNYEEVWGNSDSDKMHDQPLWRQIWALEDRLDKLENSSQTR